MNCTSCPLRDCCTTPCKAIEQQLPPDWQGDLPQFRRANRRAFFFKFAGNRRDVKIMLEHRDILRGRQREIFDLIHNEGLTHDEIAKRLSVRRRVVTTYINRAYDAIARAAGLRAKGKVR